jgi:hypothetical protein
MPHFSFATAAGRLIMHGGVVIVGVHLDGEFVRGKNELHEKRKILNGPKTCAAPLHWHFRPGRAERFSDKWSGSNAAIHTREPGFAERLQQIRFLGVKRRQ